MVNAVCQAQLKEIGYHMIVTLVLYANETALTVA